MYTIPFHAFIARLLKHSLNAFHSGVSLSLNAVTFGFTLDS